jgi:hypothetical protein
MRKKIHLRIASFKDSVSYEFRKRKMWGAAPLNTVPLIEFSPDQINPSENAQKVAEILSPVKEGSALAALRSKNGEGVWVFYEGGVFDPHRKVERDRDEWARIAAFRAKDNCMTVARVLIPAELLGDDTFVQVGEVQVSRDGCPFGDVTRFYEPRKFSLY